MDRPPHVLPYSVQPDGDQFVIGSSRAGTFLSVPAEVLEILRAFEAGHGPDRVREDYRRRHGEDPDLDDLIQALTQRGILAPAAGAGDASVASAPPSRRYHFEWISPRVARWIWNRWTLSGMAIVVLAALVVLVFMPELMPGWRAFYFPQDTAIQIFALMLLGMASTFVHEMAHLTAARAGGVSCRFSIGNQLWFVVWYTEMTGVWALPRRQRYLPILAGPIVDLFGAAVVVLFLAAAQSGGWSLPTLARNILSALLLLYIMRLVWQCYFFLRTDFYYAISNMLGCKRLLQDSEDWLRNRYARLRRRTEPVDQSLLPAHERRMLPGYAAIWLVGRIVAIAVLLLVQLPLFFSYVMLAVERFNAPDDGQGPSSGAVLAGLLFSTLMLVGLVMWIRQLWSRKGNADVS
jgi:hypothetical protein